MNYQDLFKALDSQIEAETQEVIASAQRRADAIIRGARQEIERLNKRLLEESARQEAAESKGQASARRYKLSKLLLQTKYELFQQTLGAARKKLSQLPQKPEYSRVLKKLIQESTADFPECTRIRVNTRDVSLAKKILDELRLKLEVEPTTDFSAGVVATSADGRMSIRNTLELRLERLISLISPEVARVLYG
jgi:vacuolar-type H+-ATPase subunit E/Vma4